MRLPRAFAGMTLFFVALPGIAAMAQSLPVPPAALDAAVAQKSDALLHDPMSPVIGKGNIAIVEFFDYTCPYCKALEPRLESLLKADKGVRLVVKEFPILTPQSLVATRAALAAVKQHKYDRFHQALMNYEGPLDESVIFDTAKATGLDVARLKKDMTDPAINDEIIANFNLARSLRLFQTPAFIVANHVLGGPSAEIDFPKEVAAARAHR
jgi:protein-disulfide isomerase